MENSSAKDRKIFEDMKQSVQEMGLKILDQKIEGGVLSGISICDFAGYNMGIIFSYNTTPSVAEVLMRYADLPAEKLPPFYELLNDINGNLTFNHFFIDPGTRILALRSGFAVTDNVLNKEQFSRLLRQDLGIGHTFMPLIEKLLFENQTPREIMNEFYESGNMIPTELPEADDKVKATKVTEELPFVIEASADKPAFPTHTHGLTEIGLPEFLMDPFCLGARGNGDRIISSYKYFTKPENADKLEAIKNGETIKLSLTDLKPDAKPEPHVYCYRRVYPEFEMVKLAYCIEDPKEVDSKMWFVQIYIEGDDYALTDDYYKGGVNW